MEEMLRHIIREEFRKAISKGYAEEDLKNAIMKKNFIHTKDGGVYSPVSVGDGYVTSVDDNSQHIEIPLEEVTMIQSKEERFKAS